MVRVDDITVCKGKKEIIRNISFDLHPGKIVVVVGKNGAGKTTLLEALTGGNVLQKGQIQWDEQALSTLNLKELAIRRAVLTQNVQVNFPIVVKALVGMGAYVAPQFIPKTKIDRLIQHALEEVEMYDFKDRIFMNLSGGEQKRVLLAKCIVQLNCCHWADIPKYLFLDEPTASLDIQQQYRLIDLIKRWVQRRNIGVFAVLHDLNIAAQFADEIIMLNEGVIAERGRPEAVFTPNKLKQYC
ncbi:MAG: ATP-binding cassette domain-containing protein [Bacteroidota bacterium]